MKTPPRSTLRLVGFATALSIATVFAGSTPALAQSDQLAVRRPFASRAELETLAADFERQAADANRDRETRDRKRLESQALRERLRDGDFQVGDRIVLQVQGDSALSDTFAVRAGRTISLPNIDELSLAGVLRAELQAHLTRHIGRFVRDPKIESATLMRIAVVGRVNRPGYYAVEPQALLTDVIMLAGGPAGEADLGTTVIRRGPEEIWTKNDVQIAMSQGLTLDQLNLRAGDEVFVGERRRRSIGSAVSILTAIGGLAVGYLAIANQ